MEDEYFEVRIFLQPDDFIMKEIEFYEKPNGLYYPISNKMWASDGVKEVKGEEKEAIQKLLFETLNTVQSLKYELYRLGMQGEKDYSEYIRVHPVLRGYNKNRIIDSGFLNI